MQRWIVLALFCAAFGAPTTAHAAHEVKERRTDYSGQIFVERWQPIGHQYLSWGMASRVKRAYKACQQANPEYGCRIMFDRLDLIDKTTWTEPDEHGISRATTEADYRLWSIHGPNNIAGIGGNRLNYLFFTQRNSLGFSQIRWLAEQEGLQTRHGTIIWVGPAEAISLMVNDFNCSTVCDKERH